MGKSYTSYHQMMLIACSQVFYYSAISVNVGYQMQWLRRRRSHVEVDL